MPTCWAPRLNDRAGIGACAAGSWLCSASTEINFVRLLLNQLNFSREDVVEPVVWRGRRCGDGVFVHQLYT